MSFWKLPRVPEPEEMDADAEVSSYNSAAADRHLDAIDDTFIEHLLGLLPSDGSWLHRNAWALDVGAGPAQIPIKLLAKLPDLRCIGLDRFPNMLACARQNAQKAGVSPRLTLVRADGRQLPFADGSFSVVLCNSMLHHAADPTALLKELFRVAAPNGAVLVRDLRRPSRPLLSLHLWRHGRHYHGEMRRLFNASVRAAYTPDELEQMLRNAGGSGANVFRYRGAHIGIERRIRAAE